MTTEELLASQLSADQRAAIIATCDQIRADGVANSLKLVSAKEAAEETIKQLNADRIAMQAAAETEKRAAIDLEVKVATLAVQTTYDDILQRAMPIVAALPKEQIEKLAPILQEAVAHTSQAREAKRLKDLADAQALVAKLSTV